MAKTAENTPKTPRSRQKATRTARKAPSRARKASTPRGGRPTYPAPAHFDAAGKREWTELIGRLDADERRHLRALADLLEGEQRLWRMYLPLMEAYVRARSLERVAREDATDADGKPKLTAKGSMGQLVQHPSIGTSRQAAREALELSRELLITPLARKRVDLAVGDEQKSDGPAADSPLAALLAGDDDD